METIRLGTTAPTVAPGEEPGQFTLEATTADSAANDQVLRFAAPTSPNGNREKSERFWRRMQFALDMADPSEFPEGLGFSPAEESVLVRFRQVANGLGDSSVVNGPWKFKGLIRPGQTDEVTADTPPNIEIAGFVTYLRQCDSPDETASFKLVKDFLGKGLQSLDPESRDRGNSILKSWRRSRGQIHQRFLDQLVVRRLVVAGQAASHSVPSYPWTPAQLVNTYRYGELIHWGNRRDEYSNVAGAAPVQQQLILFKFLEAAQTLGHFYVGVTKLIDRALSGS